MAGQTVILAGPSQRRFAHDLIERAPINAVLSVKKAKRTVDQNAKMWSMLSDISRAAPEGRQWTTDTWKAAFMHALGHEILWQPGLNGQPFPAGFRTSRLDKEQMADLITFIQEYGDRHGVRWTAPEDAL
ncbi:recombination protein NinB [Leisingera sp. ANG-M7]|uniref:recombination protein NinB n=1 Tax=Leisingera sp. ANG-M7 TaxID=1577902 RepID=UPI00057E4902|nr:recombination protein NinB [Leisingera sp. ANG-M7]KIC39387.1 hypothetical protein RA26_01690 [Leisingera sp. ANG-M7]